MCTFKFYLMCLMALVSHVQGHSWISCSDYREKNGDYWDPTKCYGWPRDAAVWSPKNSFGLDRGFNHQPGMNGKACKSELTGGSYSAEYPMAVYYLGQQAVITHPMKNHGAASCTNPHIPDFGNAIYHGRKWPVDGTIDTNQPYKFYRDKLVVDLGQSKVGSANTAPDTYPKPGFQNAPKFCENTDKAFASYSFNVPADFETGKYTFVWRWSFNGPTDIYTTCFEVEVVGTKAERDAILHARSAAADVSAICGGITSNEGVGSTHGCDDTTVGTPPPTVSPRPSTTPPPVTVSTDGGVRPTTISPTTTIAPPVNIGAIGAKAYQIAGEFDLPTPTISGVKRRYATVMFECSVEAMFWNARVVGMENTAKGKIFQLLQEHEEDVLSQKIFYSSMFADSCDLLRYPPIANMVKDEL